MFKPFDIIENLDQITKKYPETFPFSSPLSTTLRHLEEMGGLWLKNKQSTSERSKPEVSIITVTKNNANGLLKTIDSVKSQTFPNYEIIILDSSSQDESLSILQKNNDSIHFWLSFPDRGIYDAMNRGILLATGRFLLFLNAGDYFYRDDSLDSFLKCCDETSELVYGDHEIYYVGKNYTRIQKSATIHSYYDLWHHMGFCHQSLLVSREIHKKNLFDIANLSADYKFILKAFLDGYTIQHVPVVFVHVDSGGISQRRRLFMEWERFRVSWELRPRVWLIFGFIWIFFSTGIRFFAQKMLGNKISGHILRIKYKIIHIFQK